MLWAWVSADLIVLCRTVAMGTPLAPFIVKGATVHSQNLKKQNPFERLLSIFAPVHSGEGFTSVLLMVDVFLLLTAYYIIKPVREALILGELGAEIKSYAGAGQALLFLFFLWVGLFNLMLIAQFWAFANDIYTHEQGKRLFAIIGIGSSLGGIFGARLAGGLFKPLGPYAMMLVTAALLSVCIVLTTWIHHREKLALAGRITRKPEDLKLPRSCGFSLVFKSRYLLLIAMLVLLSNFVNTTGEFFLGKCGQRRATDVCCFANHQAF